MPKLPAKFKKGEVPAGFETYYTVERDGFMFADFEDEVAALTNPALNTQKETVIGEKRTLQSKYDDLVKSTGTISAELNDLRTKIAQGAAITADELAIVNALKGIDGTPAEIKTKLQNYATLEAQVQQNAMNTENATIASTMGWKPSIFSGLRTHPQHGKDLAFSVEDVTENGKPTKVAYVSFKDAQGATQKQKLSEFADKNEAWREYLPALKADAQHNNGPQWIPQGSTSQDTTPAGQSAIDAHIANKNAANKALPNPLLPTPVVPPAPAAPPAR